MKVKIDSLRKICCQRSAIAPSAQEIHKRDAKAEGRQRLHVRKQNGKIRAVDCHPSKERESKLTSIRNLLNL
jgi:hypothetical protein